MRWRSFCLFLLLVGTGSFADPPVTHDVAWVTQRVQQLQPTAGERKLDEIGWAKDIRDAERLAREHNRPVYLFTHDGRIATGRC
jgi:hypothetical protein